MNKGKQALEIVRQAVEFDEETLVAEDCFETLFADPAYPDEQLHRVLNLNQSIILEVLEGSPGGRLAKVVRRSLDLITDAKGSHGYEEETAERIYGIESMGF